MEAEEVAISRCRCSPNVATEVSADDSDCIEVSGSGTVANPFTFAPILDPDENNELTCGASGLFAQMPALYRDPPRVSVRGTTPQTIPADNVPQFIEFNIADWDTAGWYDPGSDAFRITVPADGLYSVTFRITLDNPGGDFPALGQTRAYVLEGAAVIRSKDVQVDVDPNTSVRLGKTADIELHAGQYLGLQVLNGYHVDLQSLPDDGTANMLQARWVAPLPTGS